jgi:hypothetical protein
MGAFTSRMQFLSMLKVQKHELEQQMKHGVIGLLRPQPVKNFTTPKLLLVGIIRIQDYFLICLKSMCEHKG